MQRVDEMEATARTFELALEKMSEEEIIEMLMKLAEENADTEADKAFWAGAVEIYTGPLQPAA